MRFGDYCFFVMARDYGKMNMKDARRKCEHENATLGNIYSSQHFDILTNYYRYFSGGSIMTEVTSIGLKTGMRYDPQVIYLSVAGIVWNRIVKRSETTMLEQKSILTRNLILIA